MLRSVLILLAFASCTPDDAVGAASTSAATEDSTSSTSVEGSTTGSSSTGDRTGTDSEAGTSTGAAASASTSDGTHGETEAAASTSGTTIEVTTGGTSTSAGSTGESTTGEPEPEPLCWTKGCDDDHPCAPGLTCELHPDAVDLWVCAAPCIQAGPPPSCITEPFACGQAAPLGECLPGSGDMPFCFPVLCPNGVIDCKAGQECIDGACYG